MIGKSAPSFLRGGFLQVKLNWKCTKSASHSDCMAKRLGTHALIAAHITGKTHRIDIAFPPRLCSTLDGRSALLKSWLLKHIQKDLENQETLSLHDFRQSRCIGIPIKAITSLPVMYLPAVVERNFPFGLRKDNIIPIIE